MKADSQTLASARPLVTSWLFLAVWCLCLRDQTTGGSLISCSTNLSRACSMQWSQPSKVLKGLAFAQSSSLRKMLQVASPVCGWNLYLPAGIRRKSGNNRNVNDRTRQAGSWKLSGTHQTLDSVYLCPCFTDSSNLHIRFV